MSSTTGLSSNGSNNKPANTLQLDASARESILARNQARVLSALGVTKGDNFSTGGGLNPLKGLYSAAAATFLKNKQGQQSTGQGKGSGSYEKAADILKQLATKSADGGSSGSSFSSNVSGPAGGGNYKKYQWTGKPGPTGSEAVVEETPDETPAEVPAATEPADLSGVYKAFANTVSAGNGEMFDRADGTTDFKVLDIAGKLSQQGDKVVGSVSSDSGSYTFEIAADGSVMLDASKGNTASVEFDQLKHLLSGSLEGVRRKTATPEPAATPEPVATAEPAVTEPPAQTAPEVSGTGATTPKSETGSTTGTSNTTTATPSGSLSGLLTTSTTTMLSLTSSGKSSDLARYNAKLLVNDLQAAGGAAAQKDGNTLDIKLNGQAGTLTIKDDRVYGKLGTGSGAIEFEIRGNGEVKIDGNGLNATARSNSIALRRAIGASTLLGGTDFEARVVKFNRYGTGSGLNLLNLLG